MATNYLSADNVIKKVYDPSTESLKTTAVASFAGGEVSIDIDAATDSIKIGDGSGNFLAVNPDGSINTNITGEISVEVSAADGDNVAISDGVNSVIVNPNGSLNVEGPLTDLQLRASPIDVNVPAGIATEAKQDVGNLSLASIDSKLTAPLTISLPIGAATETKQDTANASLASIDSKLTAPLNVQIAGEPLKTSGTEDGQPNGPEFTFVNNVRLQIMAAKDREMYITYQDFGTKDQRITQIDYTSPSIGVGIGYTARKTISYTLVVNKYRTDSINWSII